jgi:hypothetical protein
MFGYENRSPSSEQVFSKQGTSYDVWTMHFDELRQNIVEMLVLFSMPLLVMYNHIVFT